MNNFKRITSIVTIIILLMGCGVAGIEPDNIMEINEAGAVQEKDLDYEVPPNLPHVFVDQIGYETKSTKVVVFCGKDMIDTFEVIDAESGEAVYTGEIITGDYNEETEEYTNYGTFTELDKSGTYYIQTAVIGQSYPFIIGDNLYRDMFSEMSKRIYEKRCGHKLIIKLPDRQETLDVSGGWYTGADYDRNVVGGCTIAANLLLAFELYPDEFTDDSGIAESGNQIPDILDEVKYEIEWLLKMQDMKSGALFGGIVDNENEPKKLKAISKSATANFAGVMANFYQVYKNYDLKLASSCLNAGEKAYRYLLANETEDYTQDQYFAATQLYRATGNLTYHSYIKQYNKAEKAPSEDNSRELYGDIVYLMTRRSVDTTICRQLMDKWMDRVERIVEEAQQNPYFVSSDTNTEMLEDMLNLSVVGHIITNHEYVTVLENHLHYFLGRNAEGVSYIEGMGSLYPSINDRQTIITEQPELTSKLLFMLGEIINADAGMEE